LVMVDGKARGIVTRNLITGKIESHSAHAVVLCTGGYGNVFFLSTNAKGSNATAAWRAHKKGALFGNPCYTQIHPTCIPVSGDHQSKLTLMSESLRNDGRVWVPKKAMPGLKAKDAVNIPKAERDYYLERKYPAFGNLVPRDVASRNAKDVCDEGRGVGSGLAVFLDFADAIKRVGKKGIEEKYGNLFDMYQQITGDNPYEMPMMIYPAVHYTMGGLWVDYNLMTSVPGLYALGEVNFSDHGANRLGASALMQGLADGYFVVPYTIGDYLAGMPYEMVSTDRPEFKEAMESVNNKVEKLLSIKGNKTVDQFHRELGLTMWEHCGMARTEEGLKEGKKKIQELRKEFWENVKVVGG
ncbi:MAG TPA: succinate dehydrogenase (quinone) flavoprotein subunit, partial [Cyclobacteriaceae bacterium]|nr:succinate dehydrogenase (quinone) flavoprotein subunit [Cyclobacteriaceae bacterium]